MLRNRIFKAFTMAAVLAAFGATSSAQAQDWGDYLHWPYVPPQVPGNGFEYRSLYDNFYTYPREQRIVPQIQGPSYRNFYGGKRKAGHAHPNNFHGLNKQKFYQGYHFTLDVF